MVAEAQRTRPRWLRQIPDAGRVAHLHTFWTKTGWRDALSDSRSQHDYVTAQREVTDYLVGRQREQRSRLLKSDFSVRPLTAIILRPDENPVPHPLLPGWSGEQVEAWRANLRCYYWHQLVTVAGRSVVTSEDTTAADWVVHRRPRPAARDAEHVCRGRASPPLRWRLGTDISVHRRSDDPQLHHPIGTGRRCHGIPAPDDQGTAGRGS
ncbi:hypothetical protein Cme02nite_55560 [Catellatospora methionotrophica]|uniref:Uncharacterized protein n=1 Tax=Catellatospora methionotrophica TaxID=121620 RepID=A0A8J3PI03_9ACTN|nr:hypothetical protein [Catellatospora methionotrophica]GIG17224.1 hypothetical protein Cme02nite_55560 [Catellatospora methionotrophica]